ncbi:MAG: hypothetical protein K9K65_11410, partial [Desulfarculaceae bacterium]|nr:hypothetical protein [Desulfarculaceae bacterium]
IQMNWVPAEMHRLDPFPTVTLPRSVDLGHLAEHEDHFVPGIFWTPNNFDGFVRKNETVRYTFEIDAENFASKEPFCVEISWDGFWVIDANEMNNHLVVKVVEYGDWALQQAT